MPMFIPWPRPYCLMAESVDEVEDCEGLHLTHPLDFGQYEGLAWLAAHIPGVTLANILRDTKGIRSELFFLYDWGRCDYSSYLKEAPAPGSWAGWRPSPMAARCKTCGWRKDISGHLEGLECPDLWEYRATYEAGVFRSLREMAEFYKRPVSYLRDRLIEGGADMRSRGRRSKDLIDA